jgi:hypothetical protein
MFEGLQSALQVLIVCLYHLLSFSGRVTQLLRNYLHKVADKVIEADGQVVDPSPQIMT